MRTEYGPFEERGGSRRKLRGLGLSLLGVMFGSIFILPLAWTVLISLRPARVPLPRQLEWFPDPATLSNYRDLFSVIAFARFTLNSLFVVAIAVPLTILTASMAGFAVAQFTHHWRMRITAISFVAVMIPLTAVWLPRFIMIKEAGLIDSRWSLIVPAFFGTSPFYVLLFVWTFHRLPADIFEAARLEGASAVRIWLGIAMPLARPTVMAVATLTFVRYWSSFIEPLLYLQSASKMTLPLGLQALQQLDRTNWPLLMAGSVLVSLPVIALFLVAQRTFLDDRIGSGRIGP